MRAIHGRIRGWADAPQVVIDLFRIEDGKLADHWDVLQYEVPVTAALGDKWRAENDETENYVYAVAALLNE